MMLPFDTTLEGGSVVVNEVSDYVETQYAYSDDL